MNNLFKKISFLATVFLFISIPLISIAQTENSQDVNFFGPPGEPSDLTDPNSFNGPSLNLDQDFGLDLVREPTGLQFGTERELSDGFPAPRAIPLTYFESIVVSATMIINSSVFVLIGIAVLIFIWGIFSYIRTEDVKEKKESIKIIIWGIIVIFVIVSIWGLVNVLVNTLNLENELKELTTNQIEENIPGMVPTEVKDIQDVASVISVIINTLVPIVIMIGVLVFLWGILSYIKSTDDKSRKDAINVIIYGIVSLFVMVSVWGLVNMIANTVGVDVQSQEKLEQNKQNIKDLLPESFSKN